MRSMNASAFLLLISLIGAVIWIALSVFDVWRNIVRAANWKMKYRPWRLIVRLTLIGIFGQVLYWFLGLAALDSVASTHYRAADISAKQVYVAAENYAREHPEEEMQTVSGFSDASAPEGSLAATIRNYTNQDCYYTVVFDEEGVLTQAFWSKNPLPAEPHAQTREEVRKIVRNPFGNTDTIIGAHSVYDERLQNSAA